MKLAHPSVANTETVKLALLLLLMLSTNAFPTAEDTNLAPSEGRSAFAALDEVRLIANGLLQLGKNLRDFVQKTKGQISDILRKLNLFDKSFNQLSVLASEIKEEEEELKKTTVVLKANNEEIKSLSLEINSKVEDIMRERVQLWNQVGGLEEKLSGLSQGLLSADQVAEISALKVRRMGLISKFRFLLIYVQAKKKKEAVTQSCRQSEAFTPPMHNNRGLLSYSTDELKSFI